MKLKKKFFSDTFEIRELVKSSNNTLSVERCTHIHK